MTPEEQRELDELNRHAQVIQERKRQVLDRVKEQKIDDILTLDWLKDEEVKLSFSTWHGAAAGLPVYTLTGYPIPPTLEGVHDLVTLAGEDTYYENNITLHPRGSTFLDTGNSFTITTNNHELLADFIKRLGKKIRVSGDFDGKLKVYKALDQYKE